MKGMAKLGIGLLFLLVLGLVISTPPTASADSFFDYSYSRFIEPTKGGDYGDIEIYNKNLNTFFIEQKTAAVKLKTNTNYCAYSCSATGTITLYESGKLFEDVNFTGGKVSDLKLFTSTKTEVIDVPIWQNVCTNTTTWDAKNKTDVTRTICTDQQKGTEQKTVDVWDSYNNEKLSPGTYNWKIEGSKQAYETVDWVASIKTDNMNQKVSLTEWAYWVGVTPSVYYKFNNDYTDSSGYGLTLTNLSNKFQTGKLNSAVNLTNSYTAISHAAADNYYFGLNNFTVCFWQNSAPNEDPIGGTHTGGSWYFYQAATGQIAFIGTAGPITIWDNIATAGDESWHRYCFTREGIGASQSKWYVDGVNSINGTFATDTTGATTFKWGSGGGTVNILLDDFVIYNNYSFKQSDITIDWNGGAGVEQDQDSIKPSVIINSPTNSNYSLYSPYTLGLNFTATDSNGISWRGYSLNGAANITITGNITFNATLGSNNIILSVNDTSNNWNSTKVTFSVSDASLFVNITSPINTSTFFSNNITLNFTSGGIFLSYPCWSKYDTSVASILNGGSNITNGTAYSTSFLSANGNHTIAVLCQMGNVNVTDQKSYRSIFGGLNISGNNATNGLPINNWAVYLTNTTSTFNYNQTATDNSTILLDASQTPLGLTNITLIRNTLANITFYNVNITTTSITNITGYFLSMEDLINISNPVNNSVNGLGTFSFLLNVTSLPYLNGKFNITYTLNNVSGTLCQNCVASTANLLGVAGSNTLTVSAASNYYSLGTTKYDNDTHFFAIYFGQYNLTLFNEMTDRPFDLNTPGLMHTDFITKCIDFDNSIAPTLITSTSQLINVSCTPTALEMKMYWNASYNLVNYPLTPPTTSRFRIPGFFSGELRYYMVDITNISTNLKTLKVVDPGRQYLPNAKFILTKIINTTEREINSQTTDVGNQIPYLMLIINEMYKTKVTKTGSPDYIPASRLQGDNVASGDYNIPVFFVPNITSIYKDVKWFLGGDIATGILQLVYNDSLVDTSFLSFYITNASNHAQIYYNTTVINSSNVFLPFTVSNLNGSYYMNFTAIRNTYQDVFGSSVFTFPSYLLLDILQNIPQVYVNIFALSILIFLSLMFGRQNSGIGAIVVAAVLVLFYWLQLLGSNIISYSAVVLVVLLAILSLFHKDMGVS